LSTNSEGAESKIINPRLLFGPIPSVRCCIFVATAFRIDLSFGHPHDKTLSREALTF
jgi:hypothetical protein